MSYKVRFVLVTVIAIGAAVVWSKRDTQQEADTNDDVVADAIEIVSAVDSYQERSEYIDDLVRRAHTDAFKMAYKSGTPGTRRTAATPASFDEEVYFKWLFHNMERLIYKDRDTLPASEVDAGIKLKKELDALRKQMGIPEAIKI